jgi:ABC-type Fe3+/spermidine/putrescine transport system ATPase subunit
MTPAAGFELRGVSFRYGRSVVLDTVTFRLPRRVRTALLGPSGGGKSTVLRLLAGLELPTRGEVLVDGAVASSANGIAVPAHRRAISMVFQDLALWPNLSAFDNILLALSGSRLSRAARHERAEAVLDLVGIGGLAHRRPEALSGGEQQRVALARALAPEPAYLLLDEPFASIDWPVKARLLQEILAHSDRTGFAVVLVTHDPLEAMALCRDAVVLEGGRVVECGSLHALLNVGELRSETLRTFRAQLRSVHRFD